MTLVVETFHLSQVVASDNYLKNEYKEDTLRKLSDRPVYRDKADQIVISAEKEGEASIPLKAATPLYMKTPRISRSPTSSAGILSR